MTRRSFLGVTTSGLVRNRLRAFWTEFRAGLSYVRDPHGWEQRIRKAQFEKVCPHPAMYQTGGTFIVHPALEARIRRELRTSAGPGWLADLGISVFVSEYAIENPPADGWPDVEIPERPRLRP